jgi:hypothetical protein
LNRKLRGPHTWIPELKQPGYLPSTKYISLRKTKSGTQDNGRTFT